MRGQLPLRPGRDNAGRLCTFVDEADAHLPAYIRACDCDEHDGVCDACNYKITIGPSGTEYGHARATNRGSATGDDRTDCKHRPTSCDPGGPKARSNQNQARGGESA